MAISLSTFFFVRDLLKFALLGKQRLISAQEACYPEWFYHIQDFNQSTILATCSISNMIRSQASENRVAVSDGLDRGIVHTCATTSHPLLPSLCIADSWKW